MSETSMYFNIFGRDQGVGEVFDKVAGKGSGVSTALAGIGAAASAIGLGRVMRTGYEETVQAQEGVAQLEAGIKSTGNAAGVTVGEMTDLATSIQNYSGQTDDSILKTESLLLTFTNIRNVGPDRIFDETAKAAADMAAKFGGDASQQAIVLGKALNDPIGGLTALRRVGVSFTDAQQEQIKAMAQSGDIMGAQKAILAELSKEFGGAAEAAGKTLPGQLSIARRSFEDIAQNLVSGMLPVLQNVMGAVQGVMNWFRGLTPEMQNTVATIATVVAIGGPLLVIIGQLSGAISAIIGVVGTMRTALSALWVVMEANPIILVVTLVATLVASLIYAYNNVGWFRDFVNGAFQSIQNIVSAVVQFITGVLVPLLVAGWNLAGQMAQNAGNSIAAAWQFVVSAVSGAVSGVIGFVNSLGSTISSIWTGIVSNTSSMIGQVVAFFSSLPGSILGVFAGAAGWLVGVGADILRGLISGVQSMIGSVTSAVQNAVGSAIDGVKGFLGIHSPSTLVADEVGTPMGQGVIVGVRRTFGGLLDTMKDMGRLVAGSELRTPSVSLSAGGVLSAGGALSVGATQAKQPVYVTAVFTNPFTGEQVKQIVKGVVDEGITDADWRAGQRMTR